VTQGEGVAEGQHGTGPRPVPPSMVGTACSSCGLDYEDGDTWVDAGGKVQHAHCPDPQAERVVVWTGRHERTHSPYGHAVLCTNGCGWPYRKGEPVVWVGREPIRHEHCPGQRRSFVPGHDVVACDLCGWPILEGQPASEVLIASATISGDTLRPATTSQVHDDCPPREGVHPWPERPSVVRETTGRACPTCHWPYVNGEHVVWDPRGPRGHAECPEGRRPTQVPEDTRCGACGWWIHPGEPAMREMSEQVREWRERVVHAECPDNASELVAAEREAERIAAEIGAAEERQAKADQMASIRTAYASGEVPVPERTTVRVPPCRWAKLVSRTNPNQVNRGGYAFDGQFLSEDRQASVPTGSLLLVAFGKATQLYRADPSVVQLDGDDLNRDGMASVHRSAGSSWAIDMLPVVEAELRAGRPAHLVPPPPAEPEPQPPCDPSGPAVARGQTDVAAAVELLRGLGYRVDPPSSIRMRPATFEW